MTLTTQKKIVPAVALVLCPDEILNQNSFFHALHIRTGSNVPFEIFPLDEFQIERYFQKLSNAGRQALSRFHDNDIAFEKSQLIKRHAKEKTGMSLEKFLDKTLYRYLYETAGILLEALGDTKTYHRIKNTQSGNFLIARCHISTEAPRLQFKVEKKADGSLSVITSYYRANEQYTDATVKRYKFLIRTSDNNYSMLRYNDYQVLEWLEASNPGQYAGNPVLFSQRIVQKLEETHKVDRNSCFEKNEIDKPPVSCIFLSEISETMLMLTPKWKYEGILVDGAWKAIHETTRNGVLYSVKRNKEAEEQFISQLKELHPNFVKQTGAFFYLSFADAKKKQWFLKAYHSLIDQDIEIIGLEMLRHFRYSSFPAATEMSVTGQGADAVVLKLQVSFGKETVSLQELQKLLIAGQNSILLKDNTIGILSDDWLAQYAAVIKHGKISKQEIMVPRWLMLGLQEGEARQSLSASISEEWREKWLSWQKQDTEIYPVPSTVKAQLRPYQQKGFEWLNLLAEIGAGACLADDMGLGKTLQTIAFIAYRSGLNKNARHLIVCPASLIYNWKQELEKFVPGIPAFIYNGLQRNTDQFLSNEYTVMICSYGTLRSDIDKLNAIPWDITIIDESQNIKNAHAQITKAVYQLQSIARVALSGTPIMNNTFDLYAQLNFLLPGMFGSQEFFRKEYANPIDRDGNKEKVKALQQITAPFVLRRTKDQVAADLPEKTESILWCEMGEAQKMLYNEIKNQIRDSIFLNIKNEGIAKNKLSILQGILKLRQVCGSPRLLDNNDTTESVKIAMLMEELENLTNNKTLVFSQFKDMLHLIAERCNSAGISYFHFDGDTPVEARRDMVNKFQSKEDSTRVFLISLKSGNAGLNLTAADYVFLIDPWWNTAVQQQAIDRTHRIGQTKNVFAYKMICKDSIEEKIIELQEKKQLLSDELIGAEEGFVKSLTEDDVAYLFA